MRIGFAILERSFMSNKEYICSNAQHCITRDCQYKIPRRLKPCDNEWTCRDFQPANGALAWMRELFNWPEGGVLCGWIETNTQNNVE